MAYDVDNVAVGVSDEELSGAPTGSSVNGWTEWAATGAEVSRLTRISCVPPPGGSMVTTQP